MYKFGEKECKISFTDFLSITTKTGKLYKSDFKEFYILYEFIENNLNDIKNILFNGYEYVIENGKLHNLYGPALIRHTETGYFPGTSTRFYIDGRLVFDNIDTDKGCTKIEDFQNNIIYHFKELTTKESRYDPNTKRSRRRIDGVDYIKTYIDLKQRIIQDQRKKKLKMINGSRLC
jgi:hypothetical protein